jgi:hypothetical protein
MLGTGGGNWEPSAWCRATAGFVHSLVLSLSKDELFCSWFDKLTTSENVQTFRTHDTSNQPLATSNEQL